MHRFASQFPNVFQEFFGWKSLEAHSSYWWADALRCSFHVMNGRQECHARTSGIHTGKIHFIPIASFALLASSKNLRNGSASRMPFNWNIHLHVLAHFYNFQWATSWLFVEFSIYIFFSFRAFALNLWLLLFFSFLVSTTCHLIKSALIFASSLYQFRFRAQSFFAVCRWT